MNLPDAGKIVWDVIVIGAGPAGTVAARQMALAGVRVLMVDKAPLERWKVCGCCLNARALDKLRSLSLMHIPRQLSAVPLTELLVCAGRSFATLPLVGGVKLSREAFDAALVKEAVAVGVDFLPDTRAAVGRCGSRHREVLLTHGDQHITIKAKLVLGAQGLGGKLLPHLQRRNDIVRINSRVGAGTVLPVAPPFIEPGRIYMACASSGYVGLVVLEDGRLNVAAAFDRQRIRMAGGLGYLANHIAEEVGWPPIKGLAESRWRGTLALSRQAERVADHRLLLLGDAAGYVEPFTGEGMAWAITSAAEVTPLALCAVKKWSPNVADEWSKVYFKTIFSRQRICRRVSWGLRHPVLVRTAIRLLNRRPQLAQPVIKRLNAG